MKRLAILLAAVLTGAMIIASCSQDDLLIPSSGTTPSVGQLGAPMSIVGPSEIVVCVDVSDSISSDELTSMIEALSGSLSDPDIIPPDGHVGVSAIVYGDTIAEIFPPTPVTPDNLSNVMIPALQGLLSDRLAGGTGADLSWALLYAGAVLDVSAATDRHVLIMGSGFADDPDSVAMVCQEFDLLGVMVSAVGVSPEVSGVALLSGCAEATGGFYGTGDQGLGDITGEALMYMLHVDLDAEPEHADLNRGLDHTVMALVFRGGAQEKYPVEGLDVTFEVVAGPNMSESGTVPTDTGGAAMFTFNGDGGPGIDTIVASALHPGTGTLMTDTVTVAWLNTPPSCDAGGPYMVTVVSDTAQVKLDASGSSDADGDTLAYSWSSACGEVSFDDTLSATPVLTITGSCLCVDSFTVEVTVSDGFSTSTCSAIVQIDDQRPPVIVMRDEPLLIWPPNHKYSRVTPEMLIEYAEDACGNPIDLSGIVVIEVRSDEPEDHNGDGKTVGDMLVQCPNQVKFRAERMGGGNGRVYTIVYRITAENGVYADAEAKVIVPHDASDPGAVEDEYGGYAIIPACNEYR